MDRRIEQIFIEETVYDTSFQKAKSSLFSFFTGGKQYTQEEIRDAWRKGIKHGIEIGLRRASVQGQRIELNNNTQDEKEKEFLEKAYKLYEEYNCGIQYHHEFGMMIIKLHPQQLTSNENKSKDNQI